jgi:hypothetical protein
VAAGSWTVLRLWWLVSGSTTLAPPHGRGIGPALPIVVADGARCRQPGRVGPAAARHFR